MYLVRVCLRGAVPPPPSTPPTPPRCPELHIGGAGRKGRTETSPPPASNPPQPPPNCRIATRSVYLTISCPAHPSAAADRSLSRSSFFLFGNFGRQKKTSKQPKTNGNYNRVSGFLCGVLPSLGFTDEDRKNSVYYQQRMRTMKYEDH